MENAVPAKQVVWLADGAPGNWLLARMLTPDTTQVLDWYHAVEHATGCGKALLGEWDVALPAWQHRAEQLLAGEDFDLLLEELRQCRALASTPAQEKALDNLLSYYRINRARMAYRDFRAAVSSLAAALSRVPTAMSFRLE